MTSWDEISDLLRELLSAAYRDGLNGRQINAFVHDFMQYIANSPAPEPAKAICNKIVSEMIYQYQYGTAARNADT